MTIKVISFLGDLSDGSHISNLELLPKRIKEFKPFELSTYQKVIEEVDKDIEIKTLKDRFEKIDELLFKE